MPSTDLVVIAHYKDNSLHSTSIFKRMINLLRTVLVQPMMLIGAYI